MGRGDLGTWRWLFFRGWFGSALAQVLTDSLSSCSYNLKLVTPLLASVVAFLPQLCPLHFLIWSGLEKSSCCHMLCFGFSHRLLMLTVAHTNWRLLGLQLECFRVGNSCLTLSLSHFTLRKQMKSALEFEVGKNVPLKMHFGQDEEGFHIPAHL